MGDGQYRKGEEREIKADENIKGNKCRYRKEFKQ